MLRRPLGLLLLLVLCWATHARTGIHAEEAGYGEWDPGTASDADPVTRPWAVPLARLLDQTKGEGTEFPRLQEGQDDWLTLDAPPAAGQALNRQTEGLFGSVTAKVAWRDPRTLHEAPALDGPWKTDEAWRLPLAGPVFVFGQFGAAPDPVTPDELKVKGRTGVGCKIPVGLGIEVQLQGGRSLTYSDPLAPGGGGEHSGVFVEVQCRCPLPLPGRVGLEYQGSAVPALAPQERDKITQDLGLAFPVGDAGRFRLGAKHQWENAATTARPWRDSMELYLGFELGQGAVKQ